MADPQEPQTQAPADRQYTKEHEWVRLEEDGDTATVGISDYAAHELGDVVYVQLPAPGAAITQFLKFGEIESVKAVSDLFAPISGEIVAVNEALLQHPELVNQSPFGEGWMLRIRVTAPAEFENLLEAGAYAEYLRGLEAGTG